MESRFVPLRGKTHRIGNRLIDAGNTELAGSSAIGFACKRDRIADVQPFGSSQLARDQDRGQLLGLCRDGRCGPPGNRREPSEGENEERNQQLAAAHFPIMDYWSPRSDACSRVEIVIF